eukprot:SAG31_NODE_11839_length_993_cov_1.444072_1_plen_120_part_00
MVSVLPADTNRESLKRDKAEADAKFAELEAERDDLDHRLDFISKFGPSDAGDGDAKAGSSSARFGKLDSKLDLLQKKANDKLRFRSREYDRVTAITSKCMIAAQNLVFALRLHPAATTI